VIGGLAALILVSSAAWNLRKADLREAFGVRFLLSGSKPVSMIAAAPALQRGLTADSSVLALERTWIISFTAVHPEKTLDVFGLPPFADPSGETERFLEGLDALWVSTSWETRDAAVATQAWLRYDLHIVPFLAKAAERGWTMEKVEGYGTVYRRPGGSGGRK
jgi:hypothetical protein